MGWWTSAFRKRRTGTSPPLRRGRQDREGTNQTQEIREVAVHRGHVPSAISEEKLDEVLDVLSMTRPAE